MKCDVSIEELEMNEEKCREIEVLLQSKTFSSRGMWTPPEDTGLAAFIHEDAKTVTDKGVTIDAIAARIEQLETIVSSPQKGQESGFYHEHDALSVGSTSWSVQATLKYEIPGRFRLSIVVWGGAQECPFQRSEDKRYHGYEYGATDLFVTNLKTGKMMRIPSISAHMIAKHGFFQNTTYPVRPIDIIEVLDVQPNKTYKCVYKPVRWKDMNYFGWSSFKSIEDTSDHSAIKDSGTALVEPNCIATHQGEGFTAYQYGAAICRIVANHAFDCEVQIGGAPFHLKCASAGVFWEVRKKVELDVAATDQLIRDE